MAPSTPCARTRRSSTAPARPGCRVEVPAAPRHRDADRARHLPLQGRHAHLPAPQARLPARRGRRRPLRGVGPERARGLRDRRVERVGGGRRRAASALGPFGHLGSGRRPGAGGPVVQVRHHDGARQPRGPRGPARVLRRGGARERLARVVARLRVERRRVDARARAAQRDGRALHGLRGAPGIVAPLRRRDAHLPRHRASRSPNTCNGSASRTWSSCRSRSTRSTARGATRPRATSRPPRASARRRTSCTSWTFCTGTGSA